MDKYEEDLITQALQLIATAIGYSEGTHNEKQRQLNYQGIPTPNFAIPHAILDVAKKSKMTA